jgi:hypothetical protein
MKPDPIIEEVWRIKDQLAADAGHDMDVFLKQLEAWSVAHPPTGPVVHSATELRRLASKEATGHYTSAAAEPLLVRETPPAAKPKQS